MRDLIQIADIFTENIKREKKRREFSEGGKKIQSFNVHLQFENIFK